MNQNKKTTKKAKKHAYEHQGDLRTVEFYQNHPSHTAPTVNVLEMIFFVDKMPVHPPPFLQEPE